MGRESAARHAVSPEAATLLHPSACAPPPAASTSPTRSSSPAPAGRVDSFPLSATCTTQGARASSALDSAALVPPSNGRHATPCASQYIHCTTEEEGRRGGASATAAAAVSCAFPPPRRQAPLVSSDNRPSICASSDSRNCTRAVCASFADLPRLTVSASPPAARATAQVHNSASTRARGSSTVRKNVAACKLEVVSSATTTSRAASRSASPGTNRGPDPSRPGDMDVDTSSPRAGELPTPNSCVDGPSSALGTPVDLTQCCSARDNPAACIMRCAKLASSSVLYVAPNHACSADVTPPRV